MPGARRRSARRADTRIVSAVDVCDDYELPSGRVPKVVVEVTTGGPSLRAIGAGGLSLPLLAESNAHRLRPRFSISPISFIRCSVDCSVGIGLAD